MNSRLFEALKNLAESFIVALDKPFSPDYGSWYDRVKVLMHAEPELVAKILEKRPDLEESKLSRCLSSAKNSLQVLLSEDICRNSPHASTATDYQDELAFFLGKLLRDREYIYVRGLFTQEGFLRHFKETFRREYSRYEGYLYNASVSNSLICPLYNFISSKNLELDKQIAIRRISQEELHSLSEVEEQYGQKLDYYPEFVICSTGNEADWQGSIERVITSLRLLRKERIGLKRIYRAYAFPFRPWEILEVPEGTKFAEQTTEAFFTFADSNEVELKRIFALLNQTKGTGYLDMSMRRFNLAYERARPEDTWIDLFVSLESLYSKESEMTEISHRLATRVSRALGGTSLEKKKNLRTKIKEWYGIRSKIVHGGRVSSSQIQPLELEEILRNSFKHFATLKEYSDHDKVLDLLDLG